MPTHPTSAARQQRFRPVLQELLNLKPYEDLPSTWNSFDLKTFSRKKELWDYQVSALKNALKALWKYYEHARDYSPGEDLLKANNDRKRALITHYEDFQVNVDEDMSLEVRKDELLGLINDVWPDIFLFHYDSHRKTVGFEPFCNRMNVWMATGSGKSLVLIKLIQIMRELMKRGEVPENDILILTYRDDLIDQLKRHVEEFNADNPECQIILNELKAYESVKHAFPSLFRQDEIHVFYYRSDNLSDEQKDKIIDFRNYDNEGRWYIFLDEAHKGDPQDSKRKWIYNLLSRNGFLFNFSATFTDQRDILATGYEFNLSSYINQGYGKHLYILEQEVRAFRENEPYTDEEKQKIVLKSLLLLTYAKKFEEELKRVDKNLYHSPLMLTLVHSVHVEDADLWLFFKEIEKIGKGEVSDGLLSQCKSDLCSEFNTTKLFLFEDSNEEIQIDHSVLNSLSVNDVLQYVYNACGAGTIEVLTRRSNRQELALKLKTAEKPFALIKIGDITPWIRQKLTGYEIQERFEDDTFFENLNRDDSSINILMGSRTFYEGWDSNRPNVILYVNIGMGEEARKFILQSVGRGARIEPIKGKRRRAKFLRATNEMDDSLYLQIKRYVQPLETLFIFGTNRDAIKFVLESLRNERREVHTIQLEKNKEASEKLLLIPTYREASDPVIRKRRSIALSDENLKLVLKALSYINDDRVMIAKYKAKPIPLRMLRELSPDLSPQRVRTYKNLDYVLERAISLMEVNYHEVQDFIDLTQEISHFEKIMVYLEDIRELQDKIRRVARYPEYQQQLKELVAAFHGGKLPPQEFTTEAEEILKQSKEEDAYSYDGRKILIRYIEPHYYLPVITAEDERVDYISRIIKTRSEVEFIKQLVEYIKHEDSKFREFDWWMFSKIDETTDEVYIPYFNAEYGKIVRWYPDFIFWLQKGNDYFIVFVDPKGTTHTAYEAKIDGYKYLFRNSSEHPKTFSYNDLTVRVYAYLRAEDIARVGDEYRPYWFNSAEEVLTHLLACL
ncbi:MAG: DEAD/DEAH box helicase family protein [Thermoproteota archaeon]